MTQPQPAGFNPMQMYLRATRPFDEAVAQALRDAQTDATRRLAKLAARSGLGAEVRAAQLTAIRRQLQIVQRELWLTVGREMRDTGGTVADTATDAAQLIDKVLFASAGQRIPDALADAQRAYARATVETYFSRLDNGISLSEQVYKSRALAEGWVDRAINRAILQGGSWRDIADTVRQYIDPNVRGGVSYAAKRLGRTELNNAFHTTQKKMGEANPWTTGQKWNLSRSHPKADDCDVFAKEVHYEGGQPGVYEKTDVPRKPHPQCFCYLTQETVSEDEFFDRLMRGDYVDATEAYLSPLGSAAARRAG